MNGPSDAFAELLLRRIVESSINAVRPSTLFERSFHLSGTTLDSFGIPVEMRLHQNVKCVALGKSAEAMAFEVKRKLGSAVTGIVATPVAEHLALEGFEFIRTGHPLPDEESVKAGEAVSELVREAEKDDLLIFLISGGGSASIFVPVEGVTLVEANEFTKSLFENGVPIDKINLVRRHLSKYAGGKLSALAPRVKKLSLVISDVVGDNLSAIASGPTVWDGTSPAEALDFLDGSGLLEHAPLSIPAALRIQQSAPSKIDLENNMVKVIASNQDALNAARKVGVESGFDTKVLTRFWESDAKEAARVLISIARSIELDKTPASSPAVILAGGETTVKLSGHGKGGRNQHLALCALKELAMIDTGGDVFRRTTVFSFGTDGKDGNSEAAGASASLATLREVGGGRREIDDYISRDDSNSFFLKYGGLITTGPTDTNVMDIFGIIIV